MKGQKWYKPFLIISLLLSLFNAWMTLSDVHYIGLALGNYLPANPDAFSEVVGETAFYLAEGFSGALAVIALLYLLAHSKNIPDRSLCRILLRVVGCGLIFSLVPACIYIGKIYINTGSFNSYMIPYIVQGIIVILDIVLLFMASFRLPDTQTDVLQADIPQEDAK